MSRVHLEVLLRSARADDPESLRALAAALRRAGYMGLDGWASAGLGPRVEALRAAVQRPHERSTTSRYSIRQGVVLERRRFTLFETRGGNRVHVESRTQQVRDDGSIRSDDAKALCGAHISFVNPPVWLGEEDISGETVGRLCTVCERSRYFRNHLDKLVASGVLG